ncbi:MAG: anti-sigma factor antagonist [Deltaproteobacteria bacterium]|nr:MAG: anti-sigma factor antagonist [Deltaproteobacteria bacterium]
MATTRKKGGQTIIRPGKDLLASAVDDLRKKLLNKLEKGSKELIIDLARVKTVDPVGLGLLIAAHNSLKNAGGTLAIKNVSEDIYEIFKVMRLDQYFEVRQAI